MQLKRTTGLVLSLALLMMPAMTALARPVANHHVAVSWSSNESGTTVYGSLDVVVDDVGSQTIELTWYESRSQRCADGSLGWSTRTVEYRAAADPDAPPLSVVIDRRLETIELSGNLPVVETLTTVCGTASTSESTPVLSVNLSGTSNERLARSRDSVAKARIIQRFHDVVLDLGGNQIYGQAMVTKVITQG